MTPEQWEEKWDKFITNDWPHMMTRIGRVEGTVYFMAAALTAVVGLLTTVLVVVLKVA